LYQVLRPVNAALPGDLPDLRLLDGRVVNLGLRVSELGAKVDQAVSGLDAACMMMMKKPLASISRRIVRWFNRCRARLANRIGPDGAAS
jgi:hypothetical protein